MNGPESEIMRIFRRVRQSGGTGGEVCRLQLQLVRNFDQTSDDYLNPSAPPFTKCGMADQVFDRPELTNS